MTLPVLLMYFCIPLFGNGVYFLTYRGEGPSCGIISIIFFNIAFLCILLPYLFDSDKEVGARGVRKTAATCYMIVEAVIAFLFIANSVSERTALVTQSILLGIFLIIFFVIASMDKKTNAQNIDFQNKKSRSLIQARLNLQMALTNNQDPQSCKNLRTMLADLNSAPVHSNELTRKVEDLILSKSMEMANKPDTMNLKEFQNLINQYKTIITFNH